MLPFPKQNKNYIKFVRPYNEMGCLYIFFGFKKRFGLSDGFSGLALLVALADAEGKGIIITANYANAFVTVKALLNLGGGGCC